VNSTAFPTSLCAVTKETSGRVSAYIPDFASRQYLVSAAQQAQAMVTGVCKFPVKILAFRLATPIASMECNYQRSMPIANHRLVKSLVFL
jgi:hypothetical protein